MRDAMENGPTIATRTITLTTTGTSYYAGGALGTVYVDLGTISTASRFTLHTWWPDTFVVYRIITGPLVVSDVLSFKLLHDTDPGFATALSTETFELITVGTTYAATSYAIGSEFRYVGPRATKRYICLGILTGGQITAGTWEALFEEGARMGPLL